MKIRRLFKWLIGFLGIVIFIIGSYAIYVFAAYYRLPDHIILNPNNNQPVKLQPHRQYTAMTYNIGYGAYPPKYSFFMDGGKYSLAFSHHAVEKNMAGIIKTTNRVAPDLAFYQEIDVNGDRSRHVNEVRQLTKQASEYSSLYGQNYDSPYLFYPITEPIGRAKSGLLTLVKAHINTATRYSLPIDKGVSKLTDLDRAFTATQVPVNNGKTLTIINIHMSAYTKNTAIQRAQFQKLFNYLEQKYRQGNYVMVAGDYNHTILKNSNRIFKDGNQKLTWTHPFPDQQLPKGFYRPSQGLKQAAVPSVRNLNTAYHPHHSFVTMIDGYILSKNIKAIKIKVVNTHFKNSDHNPVLLRVSLK